MKEENKENYEEFNKYGTYDFKWQKDCLDKINNQNNVLLASPTGTGKTKTFLEWAKNKNKKPIIITAPIKALSNQRYRELQSAGYKVGIETGDIKSVPEDCDFICCTQEIYTNKYLELKDIVLIMDEFHYIFENNSRARTYIDALNKSNAENILICSATLGDIEKLKSYIEKVSKRDFFKYENKERSTTLLFDGDIEMQDIKDSLVVSFSVKNIEFILEKLSEQRELKDIKSIDEILKLAKEFDIEKENIIENAKKGISGYYGSLLPKEKLFIEKCFEERLIDTVVGTDALALGVNFPVQNVIFTQLSKYYDGPISKNLFDQLAGRAGRKGYFDEGHVYYCNELARDYGLEDYNYDTEELFQETLKLPNEDIKIELTPKIKQLLLQETTVSDEAQYICEYSTEKIDKEKLEGNLLYTLKYITSKAFEAIKEDRLREDEYFYADDKTIEDYNIRVSKKSEEFYKNIGNVYFDEYSAEENCNIFFDILCSESPEEVLNKYINSNNINRMLQFRKYVNQLPIKYRKGLTKINNIIREIDYRAIEPERGRMSTNQIINGIDDKKKMNNYEGENR